MSLSLRALIAPVAIATALVALPAQAATLTASQLTAPFPAGIAYPGSPDYTKVSLTTLGTIDWIRVGEGGIAGFGSQNGFNDKANATAFSFYSQSNILSSNSGGFHYLSYTDGTSPVASTDYAAELTSTGSFSFHVAASPSALEELLFFGAVHGSATGLFTAQLFNSADQSIGAAYSSTLVSANGGRAGIYKVDFQGASAGDYLAINFSRIGGTSTADTIAFSAATLSAAPVVGATVPLPPAFAAGLVLLGLAGASRLVRAKLS